MADSHTQFKEFKADDLVMVRLNPACLSKPHSKLQLRSAGPFKILERIGSNAYVIDLSPEWNISSEFS